MYSMQYKEQAGVAYDSLIGGAQVSSFVANVSIGSSEIKRGMLLANNNGEWNPATSEDKSKPLSIAYADVDGEKDKVAPVYVRGEFNRDAIIVGSNVNIDDFEEQLRIDGIYLTNIKEGF